jgi:phosphatidylserine synthase
MPKSLRDVLAGLIFVAFGVAFATAAWNYDLGTLLRMGPGLFPLILGFALAALGVGIVAEGLMKADDFELGPIPWRGVILISAAVLFFGFSVRRLGLAPALFVAVFLAALSSQRMRLIEALALAAAMTVFCVLIFSWALGMPVAVIGPWLRL